MTLDQLKDIEKKLGARHVCLDATFHEGQVMLNLYVWCDNPVKPECVSSVYISRKFIDEDQPTRDVYYHFAVETLLDQAIKALAEKATKRAIPEE